MRGDDAGAIDALWPTPAADLDDDALIAGYEAGVADRWVRVNFVSSLDGSATLDGRSGGLSDAADKRVFALLRRPCDVVLVGAGTVRAEGYGGELVSTADRRWRAAHGFAEHPRLAIVSASAALDPASAVFSDAPERPLVITTTSAPAARVSALADVADVIVRGEASVDLPVALDELAERGLRRVQCEGGPVLLGSLADAGALDELCLTLGPVLAGGDGPRISVGAEAAVGMTLAQALRSGDTLLLRYLVDRGAVAG